MIFNQRINKAYSQFVNYDRDFNEFKRAINLVRNASDINLCFADKAFLSVPDSVFKCQTDHHQRSLGLNGSSFMKFAMYSYLQELGKVNDFMSYAKRHGFVVGDSRCSFN
jgi:hypothetical protein